MPPRSRRGPDVAAIGEGDAIAMDVRKTEQFRLAKAAVAANQDERTCQARLQQDAQRNSW